MTTVLVDTKSLFPQSPVQLNLHLVVTLQIAAEEARKLVNRQVVPELGTGLIAGDPELLVVKEKIVWRVPVCLSLPALGDLGRVGTIDVDAQTGEILSSAAYQEEIIQHARRLYTGATLFGKYHPD